MKTALKTHILLILSICTLLTTSCQKDELFEIDNTESSSIQFTLTSGSETINKSKNSNRVNTLNGLNVRFFLVDNKGVVVDNRFVIYNEQLQTINVEAIEPGVHELFVLAYSPELEDEGFEVASTIANKSDNWIHFTGEKTSLIKDRSILFGEISFEAGDKPQIEAMNIVLSNVLSAIDFNLQIPSEYVRNSMNSVTVTSVGHSIRNSLSVSGTLSGSTPLVVENISILDSCAIYTLPSALETQIPFNIKTETISHERVVYASDFNGSAELKRGALSVINVDLSKHPDSNNGTIFVSSRLQNSIIIPKILQDTESKSIYYNSSLRSFYIHQPLQVKCTDSSTFHTRLYSPVPISNVKIWAKIPEITEEILIAVVDSIPAFSDAQYKIEIKDEQSFITKGNQYITLSRDNMSTLKDATLTIESNDPFWLKILQIKARWWIKFQSYGANPDLPNGGPTGNWMGIRPVHIREGIALWLNMAYLITIPEYEVELMKYQGILFGNGGKDDFIDVSTIIPALNNHHGFNMGLVYAGNGVLGLGGGRTWGVYQSAFLYHYTSTYLANISIHELGHCIGYGHTSSMAYGPWSEKLTNTFYVNNLYRLPVNSPKYLNSANNPNLY